MTTWTGDDLARIAGAEEIDIAPDFTDGTPGPPTTIWVVRAADELYVRSYRGPAGRWYRRASASGHGRISAAGIEHQVSFHPATDIDESIVDAAYRTKYARYPTYVQPMLSTGARSTTLRLEPRRAATRQTKKKETTMILQDTYTLSNRLEIPKIGLGTWFIDNNQVAQAIRDAAGIGYRHIDTAQAYGNEQGVGDGIRSCGVPREEMFVTTKLAAEIKTYDEAVEAVDGSLATTGLDYLDMMIIHSPQPWQDFGGDDRYLEGNRQAWKALEDAYRAGKLRAIGLSNFKASEIDNILDHCSVAPMVNQILAHITNTPSELIAYSQQRGILVEAHSPIAHGELVRNQLVADMATKYGVSPPQLAIRYDLQLGLLPLPKTANPDHMRANADVDFEISRDDMEVLTGLEQIKDYGQASIFPVYNRT